MLSFNLDFGSELLPVTSGVYARTFARFLFLARIMNRLLQSASVNTQDNFRGRFSADVFPELPGGRLALLQKINPITQLGRAFFYSKKRLNPNKTKKADFSIPFFAKAFFEPCKNGGVAVCKINRLRCMKIDHGCFFRGS